MKIKKSIYGGVKGEGSEYRFDYTYDYPDDILDIVPPRLYKTSRGGSTYWFGYEFKPNVSSKVRSDFIHYIKGLRDPSISQSELEQFIDNPLVELNKSISTYSIDCIVYPVSGRSNLVNQILKETTKYLSRDSSKCSFGLVKSAPVDIQFDWDLFELENSDNLNYRAMVSYVEDFVLPKIHELDYFSLARDVKPKYRKYITNFLNFDESTLAKFQSLHSKNILIVDDINTSGSTIDEIIRILRKIDTESKIFIFTLIGRG